MNNQLPEAFTSRIKQYLNEDADAFFLSLNSATPVSIRINREKNVGLNYSSIVPWCDTGFYLNERPVFTLDPLFHAGCYYVQEASSMFLGFALEQTIDKKAALTVLDLCAAPGGKSTHILSCISKESTLISNEIIPSRNKILRENLSKWGFANSIVTQNETSHFASSGILFDAIVVDAPCSGEGLFRKDPAAINEWSVDNVKLCSTRQNNILEEIKDCLAQNGFLFYSTCTYEPAENDDQIAQLLSSGEFELVALKNIPEGITTTSYGYQFYPHKTKGEGFYLSVLKKTSPSYSSSTTRDKNKSKEPKSSSDTQLKSFLKHPEFFTLMQFNEMTLALPVHTYSVLQQIGNKLHIKSAGVTMGTTKGKDFIPAHELALSIDLNTDNNRIELTIEDALIYLKCDTIKVNSADKGWAVVTYQNQALGWIKILQGRVNNYFPKELRIKMQIK